MISTDEFKPGYNVYYYLKTRNQITCDLDTFIKNTKIYQAPQGVYVNSQKTEFEVIEMINKLLSVTADSLANYKNAMDWIVQSQKNVLYVKELDRYVMFNDTSIYEQIMAQLQSKHEARRNDE